MTRSTTHELADFDPDEIGRTHTSYGPGDTIELDPKDPEQADTIATLIAKDYIEDPKNPRKRTPEEIAAVARRQAAAEQLPAPVASAVKSEQAAAERFRRIESGELQPSDAEEKIYGERKRALEKSAEKE